MLVIGDSKARFAVSFAIRCAGGGFKESRLYYVNSLLEAENITQEFYNKAAGLRRHIKSSEYLFGGNFPEGSWEYIICHSVCVSITDQTDGEILRDDFVMHPYLEYICKER